MVSDIPAFPPSHHLSPEPLNGLVVMDRLGFDKGGKNYSLHLSRPYFKRHGIYLDFVASSSMHRFAFSLPSLHKFFRRTYDFVLFNSVASLFYVNVHGLYTGIGYYLARLIIKMGIPVFIYWHETEWVFKKISREHRRGAEKANRFASRESIMHLAASDACGKYLRQRFRGSDPATIYECSRVPKRYDRTNIPSHPPFVVNVASIQERKGPDLFVDTAIKVCNQHPSVTFMWMGDGTDYGTWRRDIASSKYQDRILFPGYVDNPHEWLNRASMFFLTSRDDPFPLAVLEAMNLSRTIMAFNVGGAPEALNGNGILIDPFDTDKTAAAILECLKKPPESLVVPAWRKRYEENDTPERVAARLNRIIRERLKIN
ncbi:MAG: glycosyltransferase family 4 protein [Deltaproteobacteria bacterium]|nr:glycosyltransferase family 4 protein [Deltaproteobacteria bacterium]